MGLGNRRYMDSGGEGHFDTMHVAMPRPSRAVMGLIIACGAIFVIQMIGESRMWLWDHFGATVDEAWQLWRLITFQFLHADARHFVWNMVGLFFFGPPLERLWGSRRFLIYYLACGTVAGLSFLAMSLVLEMPSLLIGASGGVLACIAGCAILFPGMRVFIIPIRWFAAFYVILYVFSILHDRNLSDGAHLGGMAAGAAWIVLLPRLRLQWRGRSHKLRRGQWQKKMEQARREQAEIDRILEKIHQQGIGSLSWREKRILHDATRRQRQQEREIHQY